MRQRRRMRATVTAAAVVAAAATVAGLGGTLPAGATTNTALGYDTADTGSLDQITTMIGARKQWAAGNTGRGIDVAVIDTGVATVPGLAGGNVVNGPDLSFDAQAGSTSYTDLYGHGTHMASIIAGRDGDGSATAGAKAGTFSGVAPGSRVISVKVGAKDGAADVTQVIAAVTWVTQHAHDPGLNIRVLNLSYGTGSTQDYRSDPLSFAVEQAWRKGILVVAAGGNDGSASAYLSAPAINPNVLAVGAVDPNGTADRADDTVPAFSQRGNAQRSVDVVAPATHVLGLRAPGSAVDTANASARVGSRFFRGSGTSQASAVVSGAGALLLAARPALTPDQAKYLLTRTATKVAKGSALLSGSGTIDVEAAVRAAGTVPTTASLTANRQYGQGTGSVEASRADRHLVLDGVELAGEKDIFGRTWDAAAFARAAAAGTSWSGGAWNGSEWTGTAFTAGGDWAGRTWIGNSWSGRTWISAGWTGRTWVDHSWSGRTWITSAWSTGGWS